MLVNMSTSTTFPTVQNDSPTTQVELDELNYAPLAEHIARCIRQAPAIDGLVFSVNGPWGAGKSTMLEYIKEYLKKGDDASSPQILEFNPWWTSTPGNLAPQFLNFLQEELPELKIQESVRKIMIKIIKSAAARLARTMLTYAPIPEDVREEVIEQAGLKNSAETDEDPADLRKSLARQLSKRDQIVVIIDDIDRLVPSEIRQLFQLVRTMCNLPNVVYLLAFDREVVVTSLERDLGVPGGKFLEKIVQVQFDLPPSSGQRVREMFLRRIASLSKNTDPELFDVSLWHGLYQSGIEPLLETPRSVIRLHNALALTYPPVCGEVEFVDFVAIEALRVFVPEAYAVIRENKEKFIPSTSEGMATQDSLKAFHQGWLSRIENPRVQGAVKEVVVRIFQESSVSSSEF